MTTDLSRVILTEGPCDCHTLHNKTLHHSAFPEVQACGCDAHEAAAHLAELLTRTLEHAPSQWRREAIEQAVEDVREYLHDLDAH